MSAQDFNPEALDRLIGEIRDEQVDPALADEAAARVWARLAGANQPRLVEHIRNCQDFQSLFDDYRAGRLAEARRLLVQDHLHQCVACRKAFEGAPSKVRAFPAPRPAVRFFSQRWAMAATVVIGAGLTTWAVLYYVNLPSGGRATVALVNGVLYRVSDGGGVQVNAGQDLPAGAEIRTAKDSNAVIKLSDGSLVEMRERSGFSVSRASRDLTINLGLGSIIVQAAKRHSGHLFVAARDCKVAVTGTVFSVNSGVKGSRVAVIEGEVHVTKDKQESVLHPGQQFASNPSMSPVPVQDEIAWSRNFDRYVKMLHELSELQQRLEQVHFPDLRYSSRLIQLVPASTAIYVSIPNLGRTLAEAQQVIGQRIAESPALAAWWTQVENQPGLKLNAVMSKIRDFSDYLGDEIVLAAPMRESGGLGEPMILAELKRPGFREYVTREFGQLAPSDLHIVDDASPAAAPAARGLWMIVRPDLLVVSPGRPALNLAGDNFTSTPFGAQIAQAYQNGAGILFSADLERITHNSGMRNAPPGFADIRTLLLEQKESAGRTDTRATVRFAGPRNGVFAWLAAPAPLRALDFISPEAGFVAAFAMKTPAGIIDDLESSGWLRSDDMLKTDPSTGLNLKSDLARPLGGEFAVAMDGPVLPPSWKLIVEVYDSARLQHTIQTVVDVHNQQSAKDGKPAIQLAQETAAGRTYYSLKIPDLPFGDAQYTFIDGYLLATSSRQLLDRAIQYRSTGYSLPRSAQFMALVPRDHYSNFSAMIYTNAGPSVAPLAGLLGGSNFLSPDQQKQLGEMASQLKPTLFTAYGEEDRITVAGNGGLLGLSVNNLIQGNLLGVSRTIGLPGMPGLFNPPGTRQRHGAYR